MSYNDFVRDLAIARKTENEVADLLGSVLPNLSSVELNDDYRYDLLIKYDGDESETNITIEIKEDFTCRYTGNVGLEYECRGSPSGISVSEADFYLYKVHKPDGGTEICVIKTDVLKKMVKDEKYHRIVNGGDKGSNSMCYLFYLEDIEDNALFIWELIEVPM